MGSFREHRIIQGTLSEHSGNIQGTFNAYLEDVLDERLDNVFGHIR
jgi:hypothetical protein